METDKKNVNRFQIGTSIGGDHEDHAASSLNPLKGLGITSEKTSVVIQKKPTSQFSQKAYDQKVLNYELNRVSGK